MTKVLVIEDDPAIQRGLADSLKMESYEVLTASDAESGLELIIDEKPDLVILDVMLPGMSGYDLCRKLRSEQNAVSIMMLTARGQEFDRVMGLDLGADDYVTKPFSVFEVMARVRALLRRHDQRVLPDRLDFGNVSVDFLRYETLKSDEPVSLARREYGLLRFLASRTGEVIDRDELLSEVWGHDQYPTTRTIDSHIASLRVKLEEHPNNPKHIVTVHGVGYKFVDG
jgi:DNA-binding response OmpR family regulator